MGSENESQSHLQIVFVPFPTPGHMIPMVDLAKILATFNGVSCTIITTPANAAIFQHYVAASGDSISIRVLEFPASAVGLSPGVENYAAVTSIDDRPKLFCAFRILENPTKDLIRQISPDCIISDICCPWTADFAAEIGVPRFVFHSSSIFSLCCTHSVRTHRPHRSVESDAGMVSLPSLPHEISMPKSLIPEWERDPTPYTKLMDMVEKAVLKSQGFVGNTLREIEADYIDHYSSITGLRIWPVGPVSLWASYNAGDDRANAERGRINGSACWATCLEWLDQKKPNSVFYVSFGSLTRFPDFQLKEIAAGLEASGYNFLWVVRHNKIDNDNDNGNGNDNEWLPEGFRERMRKTNQGFIIQDWAPQLMILEHKSIGGMMTHCGWNSILEAVNAGLPLVTWPLFAEQSYNGRLVVDVLKIGVAVGATAWYDLEKIGEKETVAAEKVAAATMAIMGEGEHAIDMRRRVGELKKANIQAVKTKDGSSQANLMGLIEELRAKRTSKVT